MAFAHFTTTHPRSAVSLCRREVQISSPGGDNSIDFYCYSVCEQRSPSQPASTNERKHICQCLGPIKSNDIDAESLAERWINIAIRSKGLVGDVWPTFPLVEKIIALNEFYSLCGR